MSDPIVVVDYDESWPSQFARLAVTLRRELGDVALRIDHIGSTAVPGLAAKPVLDVQVSVRSFDPLDAYREPLERAGYVHRVDNPDKTKRYFRERPGRPRTHIHVRRAGSFSEQFALLFREYLRAHPAHAATYAELKRALAARFALPDQRQDYVEGKGPFIWHTIRLADEWAHRTGWKPAVSDG